MALLRCEYCNIILQSTFFYHGFAGYPIFAGGITMRYPARILAVTLLLLSSVPGVAHAIPTLDQNFNPYDFPDERFGVEARVGFTTAAQYLEAAQTLKVGKTGLLTGVDLFVYRDSTQIITGYDPPPGSLSFRIDIRSIDSAGLPGNSLASKDVLWTDLHFGSTSTPLFADLSPSRLFVDQNQILAITLTSNVPLKSGFYWHGIAGNHYSDGMWYSRVTNVIEGVNVTGLWVPNSNSPFYDLGFRTYVDPSAVVPIPGTALLLGSGLVGLVGIARRRYRK